MAKILAIIFLVVVAWFAIPQIAKAQWFAPTLYPSYWWGDQFLGYESTTGARGYGWFDFDFWSNRPAPYTGYSPTLRQSPIHTSIAPSGGYYGNTTLQVSNTNSTDWGDFGNW